MEGTLGAQAVIDTTHKPPQQATALIVAFIYELQAVVRLSPRQDYALGSQAANDAAHAAAETCDGDRKHRCFTGDLFKSQRAGRRKSTMSSFGDICGLAVWFNKTLGVIGDAWINISANTKVL